VGLVQPGPGSHDELMWKIVNPGNHEGGKKEKGLCRERMEKYSNAPAGWLGLEE